MDESKLTFDRQKHICYSDAAKQIIREHLRLRASEEETERLWEQVQLVYTEFLKDLPYLGGKSCNHNGPGGTYDCIALFAFYEVLEEKPETEELYRMNNSLFIPPFLKLGQFVNLNHPLLLRIANLAFSVTAKKDQNREKDCPTGYLMRTEPFDPKQGIRYRFDRCPIAEFAAAHGYERLMPAFCNGDYPALAALHGTLIREKTCSHGSFCDYRIVGDQSSACRDYPVTTDADGYFCNPGSGKWAEISRGDVVK